jgi:HEAT repeat protein
LPAAARAVAAGEALIAGIEDPDGVVRASVMRALERALTRKGAMTRLADELQSARATRRRSTLYALAQLNDRDRTVPVWRLADDPDLDVRLAVVATAGVLLSEPDPLLMYMRTDPNIEVRQSAERRLAARWS